MFAKKNIIIVAIKVILKMFAKKIIIITDRLNHVKNRY